MKTVLLRLEGPMQSWGTQSRFGERDTDAEPSKSGVLGLVAAALGIARGDDAALGQLATLLMAVRVDREGTMLRDYHTVGGGKFRKKRHGVGGEEQTVLTNRYYLADASFLVALGSDDHALIERIAQALAHPKWPLFLGRKAFAPAVPVLEKDGLVDADPEFVLRHRAFLRPKQDPPEQLRVVLECSANDGQPRADVPLSFQLYSRTFARRFIKTDWIDTDSLPSTEEAPCT